MCAKSCKGAYSYCENYRLSGLLQSSTVDMTLSLNRCVARLAKTVQETSYSTFLHRSIKQSLAVLQNMHLETEKLEMGEVRSRKLKTLISQMVPMDNIWHNMVNSLDLPWQSKMYLANLYCGLHA
jgi:hypothetical protein